MMKYISVFICFIFSVTSCHFKINARSVELEFLSNSNEQWLVETTQSKFKIGYPSSITPLNYYYYSSLKGVIVDVFQEFSDL